MALTKKLNKLEVTRLYMMALNGWHTHCWRSEGRGEGMFPAGKTWEINKVCAPKINRILSKRERDSGCFIYLC